MNSIRSYLALRLLIGFVLLLSSASILIYFISQRILESDFDARLFAKAQAVIASTSQKGNLIDVDWTNLPQEPGRHGKPIDWAEVLDSSGRSVGGDDSLSSIAFPISNQEEYKNAKAPQGKKLRILTLPFQPQVEEDDASVTPPDIRQKCTLVVGGDRAQLDHSLHKLAGVLAAMTILTSLFSLGVVGFALRRGLRPLTSLSLEVARIDESSLEKRINLGALPIEILPIAEKLNDLLGRLEVSFARERRFSADVSHELRTPVAELRSLSEIMLRQPDLTVNTRQAFQDVLDASGQMEALVTTLLEIVRGERGASALKMEKVDLCAFLQTSWNAYENKAQVRNLKVAFRLPTPLWVETDPHLLRVALNNLFSNAVEYTPTGGAIEIGIQEKNPSVIFIQNSTEDISPEDLAHFFERFWRKDKVRSASEHMGLGLSLTQMLCQRLQIHLSVSMPKPNLVCFWLNVPISPTRK